MIISISGNKGAGKDYAGKIIQILTIFPEMPTEIVIKNINKKFSNHIFHIKKWAEIPNKAFKIVTGIDYSNLPREEKEMVRPLFISFANDYMKGCFGEDIWVLRLMQQYIPVTKEDNQFNKRELINYKSYPEFYPNWIITDTRLKIEFEALQEHPTAETLFIRLIGKDDGKAGDNITETYLNLVSYDEIIDFHKQDSAHLIDTLRSILIKHQII